MDSTGYALERAYRATGRGRKPWGKALTVTLSDNGPLAGSMAANAISQSNGAAFYREVDAARQKRIQAAGRRFVEATAGAPCLVLTGRIVGSGDLGDPTEWRVQKRCEEQFGFPEPPLLEAINVILDSTGGPLTAAPGAGPRQPRGAGPSPAAAAGRSGFRRAWRGSRPG
jgi:hypothetical protein